MCRLFAVRASDPAEVHRPLVVETNALRHQSREHPHGWGIAFYADGEPRLARGVSAAHEDEEFERWSRQVSSPTVVAHIRKASVGAQTLENTHPFRYGPWVMAHNGTLPDFDSVRAALEALIAPPYRAWVQGETDSERVFALVLTTLGRRCDPLAEIVPIDAVIAALEETVRAVMRVCEGKAKQPSLNVVLTNGKMLVAFRHGRSLFIATQRNDSGSDVGLRHLIVSSEQIGAAEDWQEVAEDELVGVDEEMNLVRRRLIVASREQLEVA